MRSPESGPLVRSDILILLALFGLAGVPLWAVGAIIGYYAARGAGVRIPSIRSRSH